MKISNFKLGIGIPLSFHMIPCAFFDSFIAMEKPSFTYFRTNTGPIEEMRNSIVRDALDAACTQLVMLDTDQMYPVDTIPRLLAHKRPVVGARIRRRYPPFDNLLLRGTVGTYVPVTDWTPGDLVEVDATGTGCLCFDMEVFRTIPPPWFQTGTHNGKPVGEDYGFCAKLRAAGIPIYVDTGVYVHHLTQMGITDSFAELYAKVVEAAKRTSEGPSA